MGVHTWRHCRPYHSFIYDFKATSLPCIVVSFACVCSISLTLHVNARVWLWRCVFISFSLSLALVYLLSFSS
ncbi:hypothetical protein RJT34_11751 [Clitoria ternatea]|uniref:Uncharacterized protein n=1 Tax=Clitoria ternatea TaxID=43366 RepID=A0AAN9JKI1_CLITE